MNARPHIPFKKTETSDLDFFHKILSPARVLTDREHIDRCASDETEDLYFPPEVVLQPETTEEVSRIMAYCHEQHIAVTPRGAGTGLSGGALPVHGGVCLDMRRMNRIMQIDTENFLVITEPGVITEELQNAVIGKGLFYPVDPASRGSCFIGGNIAENSGGPRAVKYGTAKDYVLNLEIVLPNGETMWTGANTLKNATGYNLTQLIVGSEGTLAIVTRIVLKLLPYPTENLLLLIPFHDAGDAARAVNRIMLAGYTPSALEFMERDALTCAQRYLNDNTIAIPDAVQAHLLVEVDGKDKDVLFREMEGIATLMESFDTGELLLAEDSSQKAALWRLRRVVGEAVKSGSIYKEEDTVVPRACLPELLKVVKETGNKYGFSSVCYGHAGDGNLHVNIVKGTLSDAFWHDGLPDAIREIFTYVHSVKGTLSGEHGIGLVQRPYMDIVFNEAQMGIMRQIKTLFDPTGIMNPGKVV
ncbi:FAD-binding oxidoreductase [Taibaiella helva]|uniref:FAD-binding oxidoreductase n=1 Tax=Taibaiella helva TaxID=2301235 RepID=UPI000E577765|nr:FAD-linked oxidase C-terminal domain-containing protein [Taibaiella helva]